VFGLLGACGQVFGLISSLGACGQVFGLISSLRACGSLNCARTQLLRSNPDACLTATACIRLGRPSPLHFPPRRRYYWSRWREAAPQTSIRRTRASLWLAPRRVFILLVRVCIMLSVGASMVLVGGFMLLAKVSRQTLSNMLSVLCSY
jgi:hypothetical protein